MPVAKRKGHVAPGKRGLGTADDDDFDLFEDKTSSSARPLFVLYGLSMLVLILGASWLVVRTNASPYAFLASAVDESILNQAGELGDRITASGAAEQKRSFGTGQQYLSQHSIIYLHGPSGESSAIGEVVTALRQVAEAAARKQGWALAAQPLVPRCIELIKYASSPTGANDSESLGWHDDGATHLTVAVPLSDRSSYDGGNIEVVMPDGTIGASVGPKRGDAVVWRGWDRHRVLPITRGERNVLVGEFWSARPSEAWNRVDGRPLDDLQRYREALKLDPFSAALHEGLGVIAAKQEESDLAEDSFRQAVKLNPFQASAFTGLGVVLQKEDKLKGAMAAIGLGGLKRGGPPRAAEAEDALQLAIKLDPTMPAAPYDLSLLFERTGRRSEATAWKETALRLDPNLLSSEPKAGVSSASQLHS